MNRAEKATNWSDLLRSGHLGQIILLSFGVWLHAADELMVSTITPAMTAEIGGEIYIAWLIALYEVGSILAGATSVLFVFSIGVRRAMSLAALVYFAGCLVSGFSPSMLIMLLGRLLQGLGGGAMIAISFAAVHQIIPPQLTTRVYALISVVWGVSAFAGPMIGALFSDAGHWRGAFFFYALQAAVFGIFSWLKLHEANRSEQSAFARGAISRLLVKIGILAAGVLCIATSGTVDSTPVAVLLVMMGIAGIGTFVHLDEDSDENRMLPRKSWNPRFAQGAVLIIVLFLTAATAGLITYGPLILHRLHDLDAVSIAFILIFESVGWSVVAITLSGLALRYYRILIFNGFLAVTLGVFVLWLAMVPGPIWLITFGAFLLGGGFGAAWPYLVQRATVIAAHGDTERIATALPTVQRLGFALGAAMTGIIANSSGFVHAQSAADIAYSAYWIFGLLILPALAGMAGVVRFLYLAEKQHQQLT